jgi:hypothetical protein
MPPNLMAKIKFVGLKRIQGPAKNFSGSWVSKPMSTFHHRRGTLGYDEPE